jgi:hypothetical protein
MPPENTQPATNQVTNGALPAASWEGTAIPEDVLEDWRWINQERATGRFDEYAGQHVAVLKQTVLGSGRDSHLLRAYLCEKHHIAPERLVVFYVDPW